MTQHCFSFNGWASYSKMPFLLEEKIITTNKCFTELKEILKIILWYQYEISKTECSSNVNNNVIEKNKEEIKKLADIYFEMEKILPKNKKFSENLKIVKCITENENCRVLNTSAYENVINHYDLKISFKYGFTGYIFYKKENYNKAIEEILEVLRGIVAVFEAELVGLEYTDIKITYNFLNVSIKAVNKHGKICYYSLSDSTNASITHLSYLAHNERDKKNQS